MRLIPSDQWIPVEIASLEPAADIAVRDLASGIIIAGPGAGKTELLAQRACFFFQTGLCPDPRRILAISFKRDAATNLRRRVRTRCGNDMARRFDSMTYDSFAKGLVDRFLAGIPASHRVTDDYQIELDLGGAPKSRKAINAAAAAAPAAAAAIVRSGVEEEFFTQHVVGSPLLSSITAPTEQDLLAQEVWHKLLFGAPASRLNFAMIGRLAELILRKNPKIVKALRATYGFVFLDEFQDTTGIQYDLTVTAFRGSDAILTAVGDPKQRIMLWAGALDGVFKQFQSDFGAKHHSLAMNYRSAPELVRIQRHLIAAFEPGGIAPTAHRQEQDGKGDCRIFLYPDHITEARHLADHLAASINREGIKPSDVCVLTRTWNDRYSTLLIQELSNRGIAARVEKELQDLLAEPAIVLILQFLRVALSPRSPDEWTELTDSCFDLWGIDSGTSKAGDVERRLSRARHLFRDMVKLMDRTKESVVQVIRQVVDFLGEKALKQAFPQYRQGTFLAGLLDQTATHLAARVMRPMPWLAALDDLEGLNSVPIMTVHKSKGLEYHTVVFVGLEDSSLWNFRTQPNEEKCGFFVAFSRAIKSVVFTFSEYRPRNVGGQPERQSRQTIGVLYSLLQETGVNAEVIPP